MHKIKMGYYHLSVGNQLKFVPEESVKNPLEFFDDPFVRRYWHITTEVDYAMMIMEVERAVNEEISNRGRNKVAEM